ncbi:protein of unknown function [Aminobacter niigataensis]|nr:protein of unknown function [Aminobacter niigataensis]
MLLRHVDQNAASGNLMACDILIHRYHFDLKVLT